MQLSKSQPGQIPLIRVKLAGYLNLLLLLFFILEIYYSRNKFSIIMRKKIYWENFEFLYILDLLYTISLSSNQPVKAVFITSILQLAELKMHC